MAQSNVIAETGSAVSWGAILAGAITAAALSLILFLLGTGLGLSSISPWSAHGIEAATFGVSAIVWVTVTQIVAAGMGGYLTGRLRVRWSDAPTDEVYFRDTAHGFLAWAVATLVTAALLTTTVGSIVSGGAKAAAHVTGSVVHAGAIAGATVHSEKAEHAAKNKDQTAYFVDALFRRSPDRDSNGSSAPTQVNPGAEVTRIFAHAGTLESLPTDDARYLAQLVSTSTGLTEQEAEKRVSDIYGSLQAKAKDAEAQAKQAADKTRKASIYITLWLFVSLLIGAFSASLTATWGGRCRDA